VHRCTVLRVLLVIKVRIECGGMRAERTATSASHAEQQLTDMYARHGITATKRDRMRGTANATRARVCQS